MDAQPTGIGDRVRSVRKRRGLTQRDLAGLAGVSLSLIRKLEQGERRDIRMETARRIAIALEVPTSTVMAEPDAPRPTPVSTRRWEPVRLAISGQHGNEPAERPTLQGTRTAFQSVTPLLLDGKFDGLAAPISALLRDADTLVPLVPAQDRKAVLTLRSQVRQVAGALMLHVWEFSAAEQAFDLALADAQDALTAASVIEERCWGLIRQGRVAETQELALRWADDVEPRMSSATREEFAAWGRLLVRAGAAAIRDNRPDEAEHVVRMARIAALGAARDFLLPYSPWHVFGPTAVAITLAEHAVIAGQPETVLEISGRLGKDRTMRFSPSHRLDVAHAHAMLRHDAEAVAELQQLRAARPEWLAHQRHAADILETIIRKRRTLTSEMRSLADAVRLPL